MDTPTRRTTNIPAVSALDEVLGNVTIDGVERTRRQTVENFAAQLFGTGPLSEAFTAVNTSISNIAEQIKTIETGSAEGIIFATTLADLNARATALGLGAGDAGRAGRVYDDSNPANNGDWRWTGSAWSFLGLDRIGELELDITSVGSELTDEIADRVSLIDADAEGGLKILDPDGFIIARLKEGLLNLGGKVLIQNWAEGRFRIVDEQGFVVAEMSPEVFRWMGRDIGITSKAIIDDDIARTGLLHRSASDLRYTRSMLGKCLMGTGFGSILCVGDSNTMGLHSGGYGVHQRANSYPTTLARLLSQFNANASEYFGRGLSVDAGYAGYDPRMSVGGGWNAVGVASIGGETWLNDTTTAVLGFTPTIAWDVADVWVKFTTAGELQIGISGDLDNHTPTPGSVVKLTFTAASAAIQQLRIARVSGTVEVVGWSCRNSSIPGISIYNGGRSGWRSDHYAAIAADVTAMDADLTLIMLGLNDWNSNIDPSVTEASLMTVASASPKDAAIIIPIQPGGTKTFQWESYRGAALNVAAALSIPVIDISSRLGDNASSSAIGFLADALHPNGVGYADIARSVAKLINH